MLQIYENGEKTYAEVFSTLFVLCFQIAKRKEIKFGKKLDASYKWKEGKPYELSCEVGEALQEVIWKKDGEPITVSLFVTISRGSRGQNWH